MGEMGGVGEMGREMASASSPLSPAPLVCSSPRWRDLLRYKQVWALLLARLLVDPVWWLYITWLPLFLNKVHGFDLKKIGLFAWVPYVAADAGSLLGGLTSGFLIKRGWTVDRARKASIIFARR
jgi:ACS family hexuronate transporter-like MFS transporter